MSVDLSFIQNLGLNTHNSGTAIGNNWLDSDEKIESYSPADGQLIGSVSVTTAQQFHKVVETAQLAFHTWRNMPAPHRGEIVRQIGQKLREYKEPLGKLVSYEMGKIYQEGLGEVQEMIDICDFAVGLSRQLYGLTIVSERPEHRMMEQWHPLGVVGIISAFNFPVAVWSWNAMLAAVCGDTSIWKASEKTPLCSVAVQHIVNQVMRENDLPDGIFNIVNGDYKIGELMSSNLNIPLVSATGSTRMGKQVGIKVAERLGKSLLELGGNNAIIVTESADIDMAILAITFGAVGTAGQRCTTTRRLIIHENVYDKLIAKLVKIYASIQIGHPLELGTLVGPLIDNAAVEMYESAIKQAVEAGGTLLTDSGRHTVEGIAGNYVRPVLIAAENDWQIVQHETFAPITYLMKYNNLTEAIDLQNNVPQGLSSSIFTLNVREMENYLSVNGSDCGIANINIGTSGAEIGGAFGGEKETGGGRESGSDSWKAYMRRQTNTINYGATLPLAQGIHFDVI
ncbi:MAG: aldehyde dehydrogenase family protein [Bacteroidota bacterium]|nr:aldehyde dehydrogenase family protein [Bacteroidota bacterium]